MNRKEIEIVKSIPSRPAEEYLESETMVSTAHPAASPFVAEVVDVHHPTLNGRILAGWELDDGSRIERWLPCLHGLAVRKSDRVLVTQPTNWAEAIVTGVIDGFARRPEVERSGPQIALLSDEHLRVTDSSGQPLVDILPTDEGPVVRLLRADVNIEVEGKLRLAARELELVAKNGEAKVEASRDVVVKGETIQLN